VRVSSAWSRPPLSPRYIVPFCTSGAERTASPVATVKRTEAAAPAAVDTAPSATAMPKGPISARMKRRPVESCIASSLAIRLPPARH
jgi:hypothetical protein